MFKFLTRTSHATAAALVAVAVAGTLSCDALAQYGLGDGTGLESNTRRGGAALDANSRVGGDGRNGPMDHFDTRLRNLVVTGDVAAGRGFRGSVGYTSPRDFRGHTGSNDLFRYRADSALSDLRTIQARSTLSNFQSARDEGLYAYTRQYALPAASPQAFSALTSTSINELRIDRDRDRMAQSSGERYRSSSEPLNLGTLMANEKDKYQITASSLEGMRLRRDADLLSRNLNPYDLARIDEDVRAGRIDKDRIGRPFDATVDLKLSMDVDLAVDDHAVGGAPTGKPGERAISPSYEALVRTIVDGYAKGRTVHLSAPQEVLDRVQEEIKKLRDDLRREPTTAPPALPESTDAPEAGSEPPENPDPVGGAPVERDENGRVKKPVKAFDIDEAARLLRHGRTIDQLSGGDKTRVNELITKGEEALRSGSFFVAEQRFDRALQLVPDHPMAMVGLVNTQIGAGLHLSASMNLRKMLTSHPELIDARYDTALFPSQDRVDSAIELLRKRTTGGPDLDAYGLVLAYLGHQTGQEPLVKEGLDSLRTVEGESDFVRLLSKIWLPDGS